MLAMSALVFVGVYAIGNPIDVLISPDATQDIRDATIARYGLDRPLWEQYGGFLGRLLQGDLGRSLVFGVPVLHLILSRLPATLELAVAAVLAATLIGVPLGMYAGYRPDSPLSKTIMTVSILGFSVPTFWVGLILILFFAVELGWLPAGSRGETVEVFGVGWSFLTANGLKHLILPALNLSLFKLAMMIRLARAGTREIMLSDTVKFARAAGLSDGTILRRHVLKLISIPIVTVFGLEFGSTLAFAVVTETIFSWPGLGKLVIDSIQSLDRPVMVAYLVLIAFLFVLINLSVDLVYALLDPRLRRGQVA
ncbi:MAG: transporter permease [Enterovirga sp.]|nr:transporter permease [Enterovirga sp.]